MAPPDGAHARSYELVASWLDSDPAERLQVLPAPAAACPEALALLRALDDEGFRAEISGATACAPRPGRTELVLQLRLHGHRRPMQRDAMLRRRCPVQPLRYCVSEGSTARCVPYDREPGKQACLGNQVGTCASNGLALSALSLDCASQGQLCTPQLSCASTAVDIFGGGTSVQARSSGFFVGNFVDLLSTRKLKQLEVQLSLPDARNLQFQVYEVVNGVALALRVNELVSNQEGDGYAASPALDYALKAGTQYLFGVVVTGGTFDAYLDTADP